MKTIKKKTKKNANFEGMKVTDDKSNKDNESGVLTPWLTKEQHQQIILDKQQRWFPAVHLQR